MRNRALMACHICVKGEDFLSALFLFNGYYYTNYPLTKEEQ